MTTNSNININNNSSNSNNSNNIPNNLFGNLSFGKADEELPCELPLLQLQSKFSITSQMNPVQGLELKRMISLNQNGAAEPYIDLNSNIVHGYNNNSYQPALVLQPSFMLDFNTNNTNNISNAYPNNTINHNLTSQNPQTQLNCYQNYSNLDLLMQSQQQQQQQQSNGNHPPIVNQIFNSSSNSTNANNYFSNTNGNYTSQPNFFGDLLANGSQTSNAGGNLIFKNPELLGGSVHPSKSTLAYSNTTTGLNISNGFQSTANKHQYQQQQQAQQQQQQTQNMFPMFFEKKEEVDQGQVLNPFQNLTQQQHSQSQQYPFYYLPSQQSQQQQNNNNNNNNIHTNPIQEQKQFSFQYQQQQLLHQQQQQHEQMGQNQPLHQQFLNMEEAEYLDGARSHAAEEDQEDEEFQHGRHHNNNNNNNHNHHNLGSNFHNVQQNNLGLHHQQHNENDNDDDENYSNMDNSHTRHKTEWPTRQKGQIKYQQCRHRNIFKNFGNIFRKFVSFHPQFTEKALAGLHNNEEHFKLFQKWLKKDIRLENKKDFIEGWTIWKDEDAMTRQFKIILKELSKDFFQDFILIYLLNSKLQDLEIHLRSIGPCLAAINQPTALYKFRPI